MQRIKKSILFLLCLLLLISLVGCGSENEEATGDDPAASSTQAEEQAAESEEQAPPAAEKAEIIPVEEMISKEEMSDILAVQIKNVKLLDNDRLGMLSANYYEEDDSEYIKVALYQQAFLPEDATKVNQQTLQVEKLVLKEAYEKEKQKASEQDTFEGIDGLGAEAFYDSAWKKVVVLYNDEKYLVVQNIRFLEDTDPKPLLAKVAEKCIENLNKK